MGGTGELRRGPAGGEAERGVERQVEEPEGAVAVRRAGEEPAARPRPAKPRTVRPAATAAVTARVARPPWPRVWARTAPAAVSSTAASGSTVPGPKDVSMPRTAGESARSSAAGQVAPVAQYRCASPSAVSSAATAVPARLFLM
ncbi:hypothetical protein GCM10010343_44420 [Streptomyces avidinii]|nr:hypothetical protein GCM10010343_44420 [Streptomyces avidinii]